jgi:hypothetical protein
MARTVTVIQNQIKAEIAADPDLFTEAINVNRFYKYQIKQRFN